MKRPKLTLLPAGGALLTCLLCLSACSDDDDGPQPDAAVDAAVEPDAGPDGGTVDPPCVTQLVTDQVFDLAPNQPDGQIHATAAFDGESVWVVYNQPDGSSNFDVYGLRLNCDGTQRTAPFQINTTDHNDIDPAVAIRGDRVYVAWQTDTQSGANNMQLPYRTFQVDGTPVMTTDQFLRTQRNGQPVPGNTWMPSVAALPTGFAIAGARAADDASGFQVFVQRINDDGTLNGATLDASFLAPSSQTAPALAAKTDGVMHVAWDHGVAPDYEDQVRHTRIAAGADVANPLPPPVAAGRTQSAGASLSIGPSGDAFLAFTDASNGKIVLTDIADPMGNADAVEIGGPNVANLAPTVVATQSGGAVAWFQQLSGAFGEMRVQPFDYDGSQFTLGTVDIPTGAMSPMLYGVALTHITQNVYFVAWAEGDSPDFRIKGIFLELP